MNRWVIEEASSLVSFLSGVLSISKKKAKNLIDEKLVFVNNRRIWIASHPLSEGDVVEYAGNAAEGSDVSLIYEDEYIMAADKPPRILSDDDPESLESALRTKYKNGNIRAIHRLDRDTSGVLLYAKTNEVFERFKSIWKGGEVKKIYLAVSYNEADFNTVTIERDIDGRKAVSVIELIKKNNGFSYFRIEPLTGRKHQIRIHLSGIRFPIAGDKEYGLKKITDKRLRMIARQMLHSYRISYKCPFTGRNISIKAEIPADFSSVLKKLSLG